MGVSFSTGATCKEGMTIPHSKYVHVLVCVENMPFSCKKKTKRDSVLKFGPLNHVAITTISLFCQYYGASEHLMPLYFDLCKWPYIVLYTYHYLLTKPFPLLPINVYTYLTLGVEFLDHHRNHIPLTLHLYTLAFDQDTITYNV